MKFPEISRKVVPENPEIPPPSSSGGGVFFTFFHFFSKIWQISGNFGDFGDFPAPDRHFPEQELMGMHPYRASRWRWGDA